MAPPPHRESSPVSIMAPPPHRESVLGSIMASVSLLLLGAALIQAAQTLSGAREGGVRRQRRDLRNLLPYENQVMSYPTTQAGSKVNGLFYQSEDWRGRGMDQALQRLVERDQRREQKEEQQAEYLAALLRLFSKAVSTGLVGPADVEVVEEEDNKEDHRQPPADFQGPGAVDYDETGRDVYMGRPPAAWWALVEPRLAQILLDRTDPWLVQSLLQRAGETGRPPSGSDQDQDTLRMQSSIGPNEAPPPLSFSRRARRDLSDAVGSTHRKTHHSLDDVATLLPGNNSPLLRVKRLEDEEEEEKLHPQPARLKKMKSINDMATANNEERNHGSRRRRRRAVLNYDPQILIHQILEYMRE